MQVNDLIDRVEKLDADLTRDLRRFVNTRKLGLVYEKSKPEYARLYNKPVVEGGLVNALPPRGVMEDMVGEDDTDVIWSVMSIEDNDALLLGTDDDTAIKANVSDLVAVAPFDQTMHCSLTETGRVERDGEGGPYHTIINEKSVYQLLVKEIRNGITLFDAEEALAKFQGLVKYTRMYGVDFSRIGSVNGDASPYLDILDKQTQDATLAGKEKVDDLFLHFGHIYH